MKAPLPEVPDVPKKQDYPKRSTHLLTIICLLQLVQLFSLFFISVSENANDPRLINDSLARYARVYGQLLGFVLFGLPIYFFWRGYAWARLIVLWSVVLAFAARYFFIYRDVEIVELWNSANMVEIFSLGFDIFLLVWLNMPAVKAHFKAPKQLKLN